MTSMSTRGWEIGLYAGETSLTTKLLSPPLLPTFFPPWTDMRVSVLIPYSTALPVQSSSSSTATANSRPQSPKTAFHSPHELVQQHGRRGSMGGIFSLQQYYRNSPSPPTTLGLVRRRTVFGENNNNSGSGWGVRGVACPDELVDAVDSSVDGE